MGKRKGRSEREGGENGRKGEGREEERKKGRGEAGGGGRRNRQEKERGRKSYCPVLGRAARPRLESVRVGTQFVQGDWMTFPRASHP